VLFRSSLALLPLLARLLRPPEAAPTTAVTATPLTGPPPRSVGAQVRVVWVRSLRLNCNRSETKLPIKSAWATSMARANDQEYELHVALSQVHCLSHRFLNLFVAVRRRTQRDAR
jgi:hypothetical protein